MTSDAQAQPARDSRHSGRVLLAIMALAVFVSVLNNSMINVAIPRIRLDLAVSPGAMGWIITGYALVFAVGTALYGRVTDFVSLRKTFLVALMVFAAGSLVCALAPDFAVLVTGRAIQASGAAAVPALAFGSVGRLFPPGERGHAFGIITSSVGIGAAAGPIIGGAVVSVAGWQVLFLGTLGLLIALFLAAWRKLPDTDPADRQGGSLREFDIPGATMIAVCAATALLGVTGIQQAGIDSMRSWGPMMIAVLSGVVFAVHIHRTATPFAPPVLFRNRTFMAACGLAVFAQAAFLGGGLFLIPLLVIERHELTALTAGLVLAPGAMAISLLSPFAGRLSDRIGARRVLVACLTIVLVGLLFLSTLADRSPVIISAGLLIMGIGYAGVMSPTANAASTALDRAITGVGFGIYQLFFFLGAGMGAAIVGAFLAYRLDNADGAFNPLYTASLDSAPYSDTFLLAAFMTVVALVCAAAVQTRSKRKHPGNRA